MTTLLSTGWLPPQTSIHCIVSGDDAVGMDVNLTAPHFAMTWPTRKSIREQRPEIFFLKNFYRAGNSEIQAKFKGFCRFRPLPTSKKHNKKKNLFLDTGVM